MYLSVLDFLGVCVGFSQSNPRHYSPHASANAMLDEGLESRTMPHVILAGDGGIVKPGPLRHSQVPLLRQGSNCSPRHCIFQTRGVTTVGFKEIFLFSLVEFLLLLGGANSKPSSLICSNLVLSIFVSATSSKFLHQFPECGSSGSFSVWWPLLCLGYADLWRHCESLEPSLPTLAMEP